MRVGLGYDVHAFAPGRRLVLGGVEIPYPRGLAGHSDADVLTHALMDAILGAMRMGDIGQHFPDTDQRWRDADSLELLRNIGEMMRGSGWFLVDADCVLVLEQPKVAPYRDGMRQAMAAALGVAVEQIGLKATTTEGLGFSGRGEGVAAQAVALLEWVSS
ncbi:MAG TPA: 2-C-methyl-D-erythritol 2,4-cyclodiphosphate synthase [Coriobacteriia bacterium]|jgi:2-C-methyl-D-erythritol 2,4-cyclodiphosphate synthase